MLLGDLRQVHDRARRDQPIAASSSSTSSPIRTAIRTGSLRLPRSRNRRRRERSPSARSHRSGCDCRHARSPSRSSAQVAEHVVVADLRDLCVIAGEVIVAERDRARGRATDVAVAPRDAVDALLRGSRQDLENDHVVKTGRPEGDPSDGLYCIFAHVGTLERHRPRARSAGRAAAPARVRARGPCGSRPGHPR